MWKILQVGVGPLGIKIVSDLHERKLGRVVAAVDTSPALAGKKLAEVVPGSPKSVSIAADYDDVDWSAIDCAIVASSSDLAKCAPTFRTLLAHGATVVSTCEELSWPYLRHKKLSAELDALAKKHGGRLLGTGVNPGFLMDTFPVAATAISKSVERVEVHRYQDASSRRIPFQKKIGVGLDDKQFDAQVKAGTLRHVGLGESLHFIAAQLGLTVTRWEEDIHPVYATKSMKSGLGIVKKGSICGVRQEARGYTGDRITVELKFQASIGLKDPHDRVIVTGTPPIDLVWQGGVQGDIATSAITLNSIRSLKQCAPGLHTMASIPLVGCVAPAKK
ncbi:MAG: dihydrodipicolinate reductase [Planctomycetota bacterium]|nr:dihydrodipicolinate reductase [Planctomycetota bacterium]